VGRDANSKTRVWLSFSISHFDVSPETVTQVLKIKPTRTLVKGDAVALGRVKQQFNLWHYKIEKPVLDHEKQIAKLLNRLPNPKQLSKVVGNGHIGITAVAELTSYEPAPVIYVSTSQLKTLAEYNMSFSVSCYVLSEKTKSSR
jgi:pyruvate kinase